MPHSHAYLYYVNGFNMRVPRLSSGLIVQFYFLIAEFISRHKLSSPGIEQPIAEGAEDS